jgi:flagellar biosynthetic protein FliP
MSTAPDDLVSVPPFHWTRRGVSRFVRHYLEMIGAMLLGMGTLYPLWLLATDLVPTAGWVARTDVDMTFMATAMTLPMVGWMMWRGHRGRHVVEMAGAMYAGFWLFFPFLWSGQLGDMGLMMSGHVAMPVLMLLAMLARRREYAAPGQPISTRSASRPAARRSREARQRQSPASAYGAR